MLFLPEPSKKLLAEYKHYINAKVRIRRDDISTAKNIKNCFTDSIIDQLISGRPEDLVILHNQLMTQLVPGYNVIEYMKHFELRRPKRKCNQAEKQIVNKYKIIKSIVHLFDYEQFISGSKSMAYEIAKKLDRNTCTYCNRLYTITVANPDPKTNRCNDKGRITRPQFDHWYAKSKYPMLALSFYNLIPSCSVCNSSVKGDDVFSLSTHIHPYERNCKEAFSFTYEYKSATDISINVDCLGNQRMARTLNDLRVVDIYNGHSYLEVKDLHELKEKYPISYVKTLLGSLKGLNFSVNEAYRMVFGIEWDEANFHKRPFSKFKKDILKQKAQKRLIATL